MACWFGHKWGKWVQDADPCTLVRTCSKCGAKDTQSDHQFSEWEYIQSDSCKQIRRCHRCGHPETREAAHTFGSWQYHSDGSCEQKRTCKHCSSPEYRIDHTPKEVPSDVTACRTDIICSRCGQFLSSEENHKWSEKIMPYAECLDIAIEELERKKKKLLEGRERMAMHPTSSEFLRYSIAANKTEQQLNTYRDNRLKAQNNQLGRCCEKCKAPIYCGLSSNRSIAVKGFMSYSSSDGNYANAIDNELRKHGCVITRDIRDIDIGANIVQFMNRINDSRYVVALISKNYLNSIYCMYEAAQIVNTLVKNGIVFLPISIGLDLESMREQTLSYWNNQYKQAMNGDLPAQQERMYIEIIHSLPNFFDIVTAIKYEKVDLDQVSSATLSRLVSTITKIS